MHGSGEGDDLVPPNSNRNTSAWKAVVTTRDAGVQDGKEVLVDAGEPDDGGSLRPATYEVEWTGDARRRAVELDNSTGAGPR